MNDLTRLLPTTYDYELVEWGPKAGTLAGTPVESGCTLFEQNGTEIGIWECTPGSWESVKDGFGELMHFVSGVGTITDDEGVWTIRPGAVRWFPDGWRGVWDVQETARKVYVIVPTTAED